MFIPQQQQQQQHESETLILLRFFFDCGKVTMLRRAIVLTDPTVEYVCVCVCVLTGAEVVIKIYGINVLIFFLD